MVILGRTHISIALLHIFVYPECFQVSGSTIISMYNLKTMVIRSHLHVIFLNRKGGECKDRLWAVLTVVGFKDKDSQTGPSEQSCETGVFRLCSIQLQKRMPPLDIVFMILKGLPCSQYLHFKIEVLVKYNMYKQCKRFLYFILL